jgi:glycosyltransferase involved in cell wall biosynthesis
MLRRAIASALGQTLRDLEVVVCDDRGASEATAAAFADGRVRYVRNVARPGPAGNLAMAIAAARGEVIAVLNEDDALEPGFLRAASAVLATDTTVGGVFAPTIWEAGQRTRIIQPGLGSGRHENALCAVLQHGLPPVAVAFRRSAIERGEARTPLRDGMVGDCVLWVRVARDGWALHGLQEPLGRMTLHRDQVSWRDDYAARLGATLESFSFTGVPDAERLRLARLSECHAAQAGADLRRGRLLRGARRLRAAAQISPHGLGVRHVIAVLGLWQAGFRWLLAHPRALFALWGLWRRVRPEV